MAKPWLIEQAQTPEGRERARQLGLSRRKHGHAGGVGSRDQSPTYQSWRAMKGRCLQPTHRDYGRYGGRGITIDPRWLGPDGFVTFLADMGPRPEGRTLDRIDNDGHYSPANCHWATPAEQRQNRPTPSGWKQRPLSRPKVYGTKPIACRRCGVEGEVSTVASSWSCPECRKAIAREATAKYRAANPERVRAAWAAANARRAMRHA